MGEFFHSYTPAHEARLRALESDTDADFIRLKAKRLPFDYDRSIVAAAARGFDEHFPNFDNFWKQMFLRPGDVEASRQDPDAVAVIRHVYVWRILNEWRAAIHQSATSTIVPNDAESKVALVKRLSRARAIARRGSMEVAAAVLKQVTLHRHFKW